MPMTMPHPEPSRSYRVLVVEDEGLIAHDISRRLESLGHEVVGPASTAEEALDLAPKAELVLMDIRIDGQRDGIEAAQEIRARHHLPTIFLTAHADRATLDRAKLAGPFGYIVKPLGPASLQTGIEMAIAKHRVERLLEEREAWLRSILASIADAAVVATAQGRVRLLNRSAERFTGWTQAEAEGQPVDKVVRLSLGPAGNELGGGHEEGGDAGFDPIPIALLRNAPVEFDRRARLLSRDGREIEVEGFVAPVRTTDEVLGVVLTFRDASARHWEERQLRQAHRLESAGKLAAGAAAEYSALIALIRKKNELLLRQFGDYSAAREPLEEIHRAAVTVDEITRRLEAFGTRQVWQPETLSVNGLLRRMARLIEVAAGARVRVALRPMPGAGQVKAGMAQMESAILNLVSHVCDVMPEGGQLLIDTARVDLPRNAHTEPYVLLALTYSATEPDIERLFDPASAGGSGLALAQVHWLAAECGGYVSARSSPNGGSRIELLLPRVAEQAALAGAAGESPASQPAAILLVEPRESVRLELHNFFETAGYNLIEASDVEEAVALGEVHEGSLDVLIAGGAESPELLKHLRGFHASLQALSVVEEAPREPSEIRTPYTQEELLAKVSSIMSQRMSRLMAQRASNPQGGIDDGNE
jgi:two-component system, cell cycle sensor histidine kinase and response regulator CckA